MRHYLPTTDDDKKEYTTETLPLMRCYRALAIFDRRFFLFT